MHEEQEHREIFQSWVNCQRSKQLNVVNFHNAILPKFFGKHHIVDTWSSNPIEPKKLPEQKQKKSFKNNIKRNWKHADADQVGCSFSSFNLFRERACLASRNSYHGANCTISIARRVSWEITCTNLLNNKLYNHWICGTLYSLLLKIMGNDQNDILDIISLIQFWVPIL